MAQSAVNMKVVSRCRTLVCVVLCVSAVGSAPLGSTRRRVPFTDNTLKYLMAFGYLPASDMETGNLRTDDQLREAIRTLQTFGHIPVTGEVDDRTLQLMTSPRCGVADLPDQGTRRKRFAIHPGSRWDHTDLTWRSFSEIPALIELLLGRAYHNHVAEFRRYFDCTAEVNQIDAIYSLLEKSFPTNQNPRLG